MNEETIKNILEKYKAAKTSLEEEKKLFCSIQKMDKPLKKWSFFVKQNQNKIPENLNDKLWVSFEEKTKTPHTFNVSLWAMAASLAFLFSVFVYNTYTDEMSESEKSALLEEAKKMFVDKNKEQKIYKKILENDLIIVYTKTN